MDKKPRLHLRFNQQYPGKIIDGLLVRELLYFVSNTQNTYSKVGINGVLDAWRSKHEELTSAATSTLISYEWILMCSCVIFLLVICMDVCVCTEIVGNRVQALVEV